MELPDFFVTYETLGAVFISPEIYDANNIAIREGSSMTPDDFDNYYFEGTVYSPAYYVYFDDYSIIKDKEFGEAVNLMYEMTPHVGRTKVAHIDSLNDFI